jgi:hypothetical protein
LYLVFFPRMQSIWYWYSPFFYICFQFYSAIS